MLQLFILGISDQTLMGVIVTILVFIILREFFCWYYKINQSIKIQKEINENLKRLLIAYGGVPVEKDDKLPWWKEQPKESDTK